MSEPYLYLTNLRLQDVAEYVSKAAWSVNEDEPPWDDALWFIRRAQGSLAVALEQITFARAELFRATQQAVRESFDSSATERSEGGSGEAPPPTPDLPY